ncbi:hypothetical protein GCM10017691_21080 [Pseudonocardia petroleophila]
MSGGGDDVELRGVLGLQQRDEVGDGGVAGGEDRVGRGHDNSESEVRCAARIDTATPSTGWGTTARPDGGASAEDPSSRSIDAGPLYVCVRVSPR